MDDIDKNEHVLIDLTSKETYNKVKPERFASDPGNGPEILLLLSHLVSSGHNQLSCKNSTSYRESIHHFNSDLNSDRQSNWRKKVIN